MATGDRSLRQGWLPEIVHYDKDGYRRSFTTTRMATGDRSLNWSVTCINQAISRVRWVVWLLCIQLNISNTRLCLTLASLWCRHLRSQRHLPFDIIFVCTHRKNWYKNCLFWSFCRSLFNILVILPLPFGMSMLTDCSWYVWRILFWKSLCRQAFQII